MSPYRIRIVGDPVLRQKATEVADIDDALVRLTGDMAVTMYEAPGIGLAAPQIGVQKRFFVYDHDGTGAKTLLNPVITESDGEWYYDEGCLSVPGLYFEICRPKQIQHELDHLDGVLLLDHLEADQRKQAKKAVREMMMGDQPKPHRSGGL